MSKSRGNGPALRFPTIVISGEYAELGIMSGDFEPAGITRESHLADTEDPIIPCIQALDSSEPLRLLES